MAKPSGNNAPGSTIWSQAAAIAAQLPESRNRYADFLRAVSIGAVIIVPLLSYDEPKVSLMGSILTNGLDGHRMMPASSRLSRY